QEPEGVLVDERGAGRNLAEGARPGGLFDGRRAAGRRELDRESAARAEPADRALEIVPGPGQPEVPERVDVDDRGLEGAVMDRWRGKGEREERCGLDRRTDGLEGAAERERSGDRAEDVATVER